GLVGEEGFVPPDSPLNNMATARKIFLDRFAPSSHIHPITTDTANPDEAAARYERELKAFYGAASLDPSKPLFDLVLMGVGPDGHTASVFPDDPAAQETERWVLGVSQAPVEPQVARVTLTLPVLGSCSEMLVEVEGAEKRAILTRVFEGENLPANRARSIIETVWLVDSAALPEDGRGE